MQSSTWYRVDGTWTKYVLQEADTLVRIVNSDATLRDVYQEGVPSNLVIDDELAHYDETSQLGGQIFPGDMLTNYSSVSQPVMGQGIVSMRDNGTLADLVGQDVVVNCSFTAHSTTMFDHGWSGNAIEFDFGSLVTGSTAILSKRWTALGNHGHRITFALAGVLASAVKGLWQVKFTWAFKHTHAVDDKNDGITFLVDVQFSGYLGQQVIRLIT